jgi:thiamine biosynthesis lipoprotein
MGTLVGIAVRGDNTDQLETLIREMFAEMERLEAILSEWRSDSAVSAANRAAGVAPIRMPVALAEVMEVAGDVSRATQGAFDSSWAALSDLWTVDDPDFRPPSPEAIANARKLVNYRDVVIDAKAGTMYLRRCGMRLGLGGIAKAYIAEHAADFAVANGASHVLIDAGGDVVARGRNGDRRWTVGIRDPRVAARLLATVELHDETIVTSGDYEHFANVEGQRYHHLIDPRTGAPACESRSATVIAPGGALADALATGLFVLGARGLDVVRRFAGVAALLIDSDGAAHLSAHGATRFRLHPSCSTAIPRA